MSTGTGPGNQEQEGETVRIFVDCDDTLILYDTEADTHPYGMLYGTPWRPNQPLIDALLMEEDVFIWSGGGKQYAAEIAARLDLPFPALDKSLDSFQLIQEGDLVIDDQDLGGRRTHGPFDWPGPTTPPLATGSEGDK